MGRITLPRRTVLRTAGLMTAAAATPFVRSVRAAAAVVPKGKIVLAWHTNIAARWLDPQQHDGTASPDNFLMALQDALIKNFREVHYDQPALAEGFDLAEDAKSATFRLRRGTKFHDSTPLTPADVKWSYEHYRGAWGEVLHENTQGVGDRRRPYGPLPLQQPVSRFPDPARHEQCKRCRLGGSGEIL